MYREICRWGLITFPVWMIHILSVLTSSVHYVPHQRINMNDRHLQFPEMLQAGEGALGNHSDLCLLNFPVDTKTATHISSQRYSYRRNFITAEKSFKKPLVAIFCSVAGVGGHFYIFNFVFALNNEAGQRGYDQLLTHVWEFSFHARSKLFVYYRNTPILFCIWWL